MASRRGYIAALRKLRAVVKVPEVIFADNFPNTGTSDAALSTVNWMIASSDLANEYNTSFSAVSSAVGLGPTAPVNAGYTTETDKGILYKGSSGARYFMWTSKYVISRSAHPKLKLQVHVGHSVLYSNNFMVRVGGQWYMSTASIAQTTATSGASTFPTTAILFEAEVDLSSSLWYPFTYTPGTTMSADFGTQVVLPAGDIEAFGIHGHLTGANGTARIDGYRITSI